MLGIQDEPGLPVRWTHALRLWAAVAAGAFLLGWITLGVQAGFIFSPIATILVLLRFGRLREPALFRPSYARTAFFGSVAVGTGAGALFDSVVDLSAHGWWRALSQFGTGVLIMLLFVAITHLPVRNRPAESVVAAAAE